MIKFSWDVEDLGGKPQVSIEEKKYKVSSEIAAIFHALMCINDTLEELTKEVTYVRDTIHKGVDKL